MSDVQNKKIKMHWALSPQCNCLFGDFFDPIPNVEFQYLKWSGNKRKIRPRNTATSIDLFPHDEKIYQKNHLVFKPNSRIIKNIQKTKEKINGPYIACHIRRTDIGRIQSKYNIQPPSDNFFEEFIESHPDHKIFLATDNRSTWLKFKNNFGKRMFYYSQPRDDGSKRWPRRTSTMEEAVVDIFMCIDSAHFLGTVCSSFSGFIKNYKEGKKCQREIQNGQLLSQQHQENLQN